MSVYFDFDKIYERRPTSSSKWLFYDEDVLPMWVADMDFQAPPVVLEALHRRVDHGIFGYTMTPEELKSVLVERMKRLYNWEIEAADLVFNPGMVLMLNVIAQAVGKPGDGIIMNTPVYGPFLTVPPHRQRFVQTVDMRRIDEGQTFRYELDFESFEAAITRQTSLYYLCDPHNPAGRVFRRDELERLAEICLRHQVTICADAIHADLLMADHRYIPIASLSPEIEQQTITMIAPTKTYNLAGLACSIAIIRNKELRERVQQISWSSGYHVDVLAYEAALAAYRDGNEWLAEALAYMTANRDYMVRYMREHLPMLRMTVPEATYLAWIDCSGLQLPAEYTSAYDFFVKKARVAVNPGAFFGKGNDHLVRLNYACPRSMLEEGLERIKAAVYSVASH